MPKLTKEFSDSIGFKSLGHLISFVGEHQLLGVQIQEFFDNSFKDACRESYKLIAEAGIDPTMYVKKDLNKKDFFAELRRSIPIKKDSQSPTRAAPESPEAPKPVVVIPDDDLVVEIEGLNTTIEILEKEKKNLVTELELLRKQNNDLLKQNNQYFKELEQAKAKIQDQSNTLKKFQEWKTKNETATQDLIKKNSELELASSHYKKVIFKYKQEDEELQNIIRKRCRQ